MSQHQQASGKPSRKGFEPTDEKEDLRIEGIAQDVILKHEERMGKVREAVDKLLGASIELHELGQISKPVQRNSCLKHPHLRRRLYANVIVQQQQPDTLGGPTVAGIGKPLLHINREQCESPNIFLTFRSTKNAVSNIESKSPHIGAWHSSSGALG